ncbi:MAG: VWA domain-containing protein [Hyphomicrobium sp.]
MSRMSQSLSLVAGLALGCFALATTTAAQDAPPTSMIVVDGSGSMWGGLGAEKIAKLEMVREALRTLLPSLRADARVGLASFGHRRRGSCGDAEVIVPPDANSAERLAIPVDKLNAVGKGPLVLALRESANAIAGATPASVILIADDIDNCGQDVLHRVERHPGGEPQSRRSHRRARFRQSEDRAHQLHRAAHGRQAVERRGSCGFTSALGQAIALAHLQSGAPDPLSPAAQAGRRRR